MPQGSLPTLCTEHRDKETCPCFHSTGEWKIDCVECKQLWHLSCVGLKGLTDKAIPKLLQWKCPLCFVPPRPPPDLNCDVAVCHVCKDTLAIQQANNLLERTILQEHTAKMAEICETVNNNKLVELKETVEKLNQEEESKITIFKDLSK